jgi:hypothetical protein
MFAMNDEDGIAEQIGNALGPLRRSKTRAQAQARAETAIEMLRKEELPIPGRGFDQEGRGELAQSH